ncbi:hypothetical protein [Thalassoglobus polymorphus]|uniref:Uncharacterized protein n=1 Tax=Thalassoglobus polymorphus TaxID=2527994 RepID=A0A517QMG0_9PLAN|nr:hypothetical protein [Thalassoglobus polymorphus]QDT32829.1 hypothetical protein Mal48_20760 [Thalassoglobus polymorphus]
MSTKEVEDPASSQHRQDRFLRWRGFVRILLIVEVVALACLAYWNAVESASILPSLIDQAPKDPFKTIFISAANSLLELSLLTVLSFLIGAAFSPGILVTSWPRFLASWFTAFILAFSLTTLFTIGKHRLPIVIPSFVVVLALIVASLSGSWLGTTWMRSRSLLGWFLFQTCFIGVVFIGGTYFMAQLAFSGNPLEIAETKVASDDRRNLVKIFKEHDPRKLQSEETRKLSLTETELNQLLSWGLSVFPGDHQEKLTLKKNLPELQVSLQLPENQFTSSRLNLTTAGEVTTHQGVLGYRPKTFVIGNLSIPPGFLKFCGPILFNNQWNSPTADRFLHSLKKIKIDDGLATVTYSQLNVNRENLRQAMLEFGLIEDLEPTITIYVNTLIGLSENRPQLTFGDCFVEVFSEARKRSVDGDPVKENRAAILALGYALGHRKLRLFLGENVPVISNEQLKKFRKIKLRDRQDWTQHFTVSAALQVLSNSSISMDIGILKEELDANGGSGFSFGDLLADRAGTMFAFQATSSKANAIELQNHLNSGFQESDYIPDGADLPEGLSDQEFQAEYGGVGGDGYQELLDEIDGRIKECAAYQTDE